MGSKPIERYDVGAGRRDQLVVASEGAGVVSGGTRALRRDAGGRSERGSFVAGSGEPRSLGFAVRRVSGRELRQAEAG
ncbi:hypothetical protein D3C76_1729250 [compost metagenome]